MNALRRWAFALGGLVLFVGAAHLVGIGNLFVTEGTPEARQVAFLISVGLIQMTGGALNLVAGVGLGRGAKWAVGVSTFACALLAAFAVAVFPVMLKGGVLLSLAPVLYFISHLGLAGALWRRRAVR